MIFHAPNAITALWQLTGLEMFAVEKTVGVKTSAAAAGLSTVYPVAVYSVYAYLCVGFVYNRQTTYELLEGMTGSTLQIRLIRDTKTAMMFVASTAVYWFAVVYRREHVNVYEEHAAVVLQLFGTVDIGDRMPSSTRHASDVCCWALYALLAVALSLDAYRYVGTQLWKYMVISAWSNYVLFTGSMQFAVTVFGLRQCYCRLNDWVRAGAVAEPSRVQLQNVVFISVLDKVNSFTMLQYFFDLHWSITQITTKVNSLFKFRLSIFFLCGVLHLIFSPYLLSMTILRDNVIILSHMLERVLWFIIHIFQVILMIYPCALLEEEAAKTQIFFGNYLNTKIDFLDIKKIETYTQQLDTNKPEFSIYSMFVINKQLVVTLTGAITTYLVIILQLQGQ